MAYRVGLTGNIGCGKSTVGRMLAELGAEYLDADEIVHQLYRPGSPESGRIIARFGPSVLSDDRAVDRRKLAQIVFRNPRALKDLEQILHPSVRARIQRRLAASSAAVVVVDAIKLLESGLAEEMDSVWVVTCAPEQQQRRLLASRRHTAREARLRIAAQSPQEEKVRRAQVVIDNSGSLEDTGQQVARAWEGLLKRAKGAKRSAAL